ncbi:hypothetical protein DPV78_005024 [Talaromyces pinophilus]|nr:hypothetical protein DPV78_005024 [Talaromyces pinophilus]
MSWDGFPHLGLSGYISETEAQPQMVDAQLNVSNVGSASVPGLGSQFRGPVVLASGVWKGGRKLYQTDGNTECDEVYQDLTPYKGRLTTTANLRQNDKIIAVGAEQIEYPMPKTRGTPKLHGYSSTYPV